MSYADSFWANEAIFIEVAALRLVLFQGLIAKGSPTMSPTVDFHFCIRHAKNESYCRLRSVQYQVESERFNAARNEIAEAALDKISDLHPPLVIIPSLDQFVCSSFIFHKLTHLAEARRVWYLCDEQEEECASV